MSKNIEVEARSFVDDEQFNSLKGLLDKNFEFIEELDEVTVYFSGEKDLRMRKNQTEAFVILKEGEIHNDFRKEFEVRINKDDFDNMVALLKSLGYEIEIEWFRKRREYKQGDIKILLDDTKGYGKILELEQIVEEGEEDASHEELLGKIKELGIEKMTSKEEFNEKFQYYKDNWKTLIK